MIHKDRSEGKIEIREESEMELGVRYQLLDHGVDSFIYCSCKYCTSCNVSCSLIFCLMSVYLRVCCYFFVAHTPPYVELLLL